MLGALIAIAASSPDSLDKLEHCRAAVHGALETAAAACQPSTAPIDALQPVTFSAACTAALRAGFDAGRLGPSLPAPARAGLIQHFDKADAQCRAPATSEPPTRNVVNLWD